MIYFSYNDFADCAENGEMYEIKRVEENIAKYEIKNGIRLENQSENHIIKLLKEKSNLRDFLKDFSDLYKIENNKNIQNIHYCNNIKSISDVEINNYVICKVKGKEIFIFIKVIENNDCNISYKMFEHSSNIIKSCDIKHSKECKSRPIVIPIVIYLGQEKWRNVGNRKMCKKINYITYKDNKINFSYNIIDIGTLKISELNNMNSQVAKEIIKLKNKYLQIN